MSAKKDDGGYAYPIVGACFSGGHSMDCKCFSDTGMTLRDAFAIGAISGVAWLQPEEIARRAYAVADAMLKERVK